MIINGPALLAAEPIKDMLITKKTLHGVSHGLSEVGYDIRIKQRVVFKSNGYYAGGHPPMPRVYIYDDVENRSGKGRFALASSMEEFQMPSNLAGIVHDKSTWARRGLSVFNTVIEPGWKGFLTLELVYHGSEELVIPAGAGIAQVIFHQTRYAAQYEGKYQNQADRPVEAIAS